MQLVLLFFSLTVLLSGCASQSAPQYQAAANAPTANYGQVQTSNLDSVIREGSDYITGKLPLRSRIGVVNMNSPSANLSNYVIDGIVMHLVNTETFFVIERSELGAVQREKKYQLSGEVSDETAVSIGKQLGTQMIVTGSILPFGSDYSLRLKIIDVKTAQIIGTRIFTIRTDTVLLSLLRPPPLEPKPAVVAVPEPKKETPQTVIMGDVNITNNNTTTIHGDVYINAPKGSGR